MSADVVFWVLLGLTYAVALAGVIYADVTRSRSERSCKELMAHTREWFDA
jgi:hypothetical protein